LKAYDRLFWSTAAGLTMKMANTTSCLVFSSRTEQDAEETQDPPKVAEAMLSSDRRHRNPQAEKSGQVKSVFSKRGECTWSRTTPGVPGKWHATSTPTWRPRRVRMGKPKSLLFALKFNLRFLRFFG
jgi:hypothetical protein